jgi:hypothetical protein
MTAAKAYRNALLAMSTATAAFASAMEACSRSVRIALNLLCSTCTFRFWGPYLTHRSVKGCRSANSALAGASGLQYLVSNHEQLLADTVYRQFEIPLLEALDHYKLITADRLVAYEQNLHEQSGRIRKTEADNLKVGRRRKRGAYELPRPICAVLTRLDLQSFRTALAELQKQVDELDALKASYHEEVLEGEEEVNFSP